VQASCRHVKERAFAGDESIFSQLESHLAFKDKKRLFLPAVNVRWRSAAGRHNGLERGVLAVRLFTGGEEAVQVSDDPDLLTCGAFRTIGGCVIETPSWASASVALATPAGSLSIWHLF
jgi:hypothetical protein